MKSHAELLKKIAELNGDLCDAIDDNEDTICGPFHSAFAALSIVTNLHSPQFYPQNCDDETCCPSYVACYYCGTYYPCSTIKAIEEAIQ